SPYTFSVDTWLYFDGTRQLQVKAVDTHGNVKYSGIVEITIENAPPSDTTPPVVTAPANQIAEATSASGRVITYPAATATDNVDGTLTATCTPASGSMFPLGTTTVTCTATDSAGNIGTASFTVTVRDTTPPALTLPSSMTVEATSASGRIVTFTATATDLVDGSRPVTCTPSSGSTFPITTTTVNCSASDTRGNTRTGSFTVTVQDTTLPTVSITSPSNGQTVGGTLGVSASASDQVGVAYVDFFMGTSLPLQYMGRDISSPYTFSVDTWLYFDGTRQLQAKAVDSHGNVKYSGIVEVTIENAPPSDTTPPVVTAPANQIAEATSASGRVITYPAATA
ncbi:MAG: HYR domain-containing protein, partial [Nitrososphaerales archaeon]